MKNTKKKIKNTSPKKAIAISKKNDNKGIFPIGDRIVLKPISEEMNENIVSGIIIPETVSKEKPEQGIVVAVGDGKWVEGKKVALSIKVGDKVLFSKYGFDEIKYGGEEFYVLREDSILAIIK